MWFTVSGGLVPLSQSPDKAPDSQLLEILSTGEALELCEKLPGRPALKRVLGETAEYCRAEVMPDCTLGTLVIPDRQNALKSSFSAVFCLTDQLLLLVVPDGRQRNLLDRLSLGAGEDCSDIFQLFFRFLSLQIGGDMMLLQNYEKRLSTMEEAIAESFPREWEKNINLCRRDLLKLQAFYQQMMDMCDILADNGNHLFPEEYTQHFPRLGSRIDRLYDHTQMLREYALQIREIYQAQMDLKQNDTMRMLTVVTTIFLPLSLLTGWYGMNFDHMPGLHEPTAYFILIGICAAIILLEIWYFKKKGWI